MATDMKCRIKPDPAYRMDISQHGQIVATVGDEYDVMVNSFVFGEIVIRISKKDVVI